MKPETPTKIELRMEIARLRAMIQYAIDGPDADLAEALGGRAIDCCKAILRDALAESEVEG